MRKPLAELACSVLISIPLAGADACQNDVKGVTDKQDDQEVKQTVGTGLAVFELADGRVLQHFGHECGGRAGATAGHHECFSVILETVDKAQQDGDREYTPKLGQLDETE